MTMWMSIDKMGPKHRNTKKCTRFCVVKIIFTNTKKCGFKYGCFIEKMLKETVKDWTETGLQNQNNFINHNLTWWEEDFIN